jgi:hypothetical protein
MKYVEMEFVANFNVMMEIRREVMDAIKIVNYSLDLIAI